MANVMTTKCPYCLKWAQNEVVKTDVRHFYHKRLAMKSTETIFKHNFYRLQTRVCCLCGLEYDIALLPKKALYILIDSVLKAWKNASKYIKENIQLRRENTYLKDQVRILNKELQRFKHIYEPPKQLRLFTKQEL